MEYDISSQNKFINTTIAMVLAAASDVVFQLLIDIILYKGHTLSNIYISVHVYSVPSSSDVVCDG